MAIRVISLCDSLQVIVNGLSHLRLNTWSLMPFLRELLRLPYTILVLFPNISRSLPENLLLSSKIVIVNLILSEEINAISFPR
jgi:hypothetical protein